MGKRIIRIIIFLLGLLFLFVIGFFIGRGARTTIFPPDKVQPVISSAVQTSQAVSPTAAPEISTEIPAKNIPTAAKETNPTEKVFPSTPAIPTVSPVLLTPTIFSASTSTPSTEVECNVFLRSTAILLATSEVSQPETISQVYLLLYDARQNSATILRLPPNLMISGKFLSSLNIAEMTINQIYSYILKNALGNPAEIKTAALKNISSNLADYLNLPVSGFIFYPNGNIKDIIQIKEILKNGLAKDTMTDINSNQIDQMKCISQILEKNNTNFTEIPADMVIIDIQGNYRLNLEQFKSFISARFNPE